MKCNICGCREFVDVGVRRNARCKSCGSYERTRVMKLVLDRLPIDRDTKILHLGPERGLATYLRRLTGHYVPADIDLSRYDYVPDIRYFDLCDLPSYERFGSFDLIIHAHVIEHIAFNYSAVLIRLHKMLTDRGHHVFSVPIYGACFDEYLGPLTAEEAKLRFGQFDHVRRFSPCDLQRTLGALFHIPESYDLLSRFDEGELRDANVPEHIWAGYSDHSVFCLERDAVRV